MGLLSSLVGPVLPYIQDKSFGVLFFSGIFSFIIISVVFNVISQLLFKDNNKPPMVFHWLPFFGSTISYGIDPYKFFFDCRDKYGDVFTFVLLGKRMTVCLGPKGNDFVFNGKLADLCAEEAYTHLTTPVFGEGVVYDCPNHMLMEQKKFMKFGLTTETFKAYVPLINDEVLNFFKCSPFFKGKSGSAPLTKVIPELTLFTASRSLQGKEVRDALNGSHAELFHDLDNGFTPVNFMFPWLPLPKNKRRDHAQRQMAKLYTDIITRRKAGTDKSSHTDMIWNLMNRTYKNGRPLTDKEIAHCMIALLMAGQHTSMATTSWVLLHLAERPDIVEELYQEQIKIFGPELSPLTFDKLSEMNGINNVIKEILRIHPPLHSIIRKVKSPMQVEGTNYVIPNSHFVMAAPGVSAVDENYFKNPYAFDPSRWIGQEKVEEDAEKVDFGYGLVSKGAASPYLPFGAGRHRCIGEQFANVQLGTIIATFVREFTFALPAGQATVPPVDYNSMVALPTAPSEIRWTRRNPESEH